MVGVQYGSDDVSAIVLDIGSSSTRAGYAGEDSPKTIIPSQYGFVPASDGAPEARYFFGQAGPSVWRPRQQVHSPVRDGIVEDWSAAERLIECALRDGGGMRLDSLRDHPLLATEATWVPKEGRERLCELAFEGWDAPAYYSADRAVLSAFSAGKGTALVVDVGEDATTVTPVYDGFVIRKAIQKSPIGAGLVTAVLSTTLRAQGRPKLIASHYMLKNKVPVDVEAVPQAILRPERMPGQLLEGSAEPLTTESFARHAEAQTLHEFKETVCAVFESTPFNEDLIRSRPPKAFEFPDGYNATYGHYRYAVPEVFFNPQLVVPPEFSAAPRPPSTATIPLPPLSSAVPVSHMIINAVNGCDADLLPHMLSNIVIVGGGSLMHGFADRLSSEMTTLAQGYKIKVHAPGNTIERKYSSWLGGSILASLGTFNQLWISREEYNEFGGAGVVHRRAR